MHAGLVQCAVAFDADGPMFRNLRIAILVYVLLFVAVGQYLTFRTATAWDRSLWVDAYLLNADAATDTARYLEALPPDAFTGIVDHLSKEARRYGLDVEQPLRIEIAGQLSDPPPALPPEQSFIGTIWWSLRMRWYTARLHWNDGRPSPDITLFLNYHSTADGLTLDRSTALRKAMIAVANVFADRRMSGSNAVVITHELLHTLGASDKYAPATNQPIYPAGYADRDRKPLHPQAKAELMAGRIAINATDSVIPETLARTIIGPETALEIGWIGTSPVSSAQSEAGVSAWATD